MRQWTFDTREVFVAALHTAVVAGGAAEAVPVVTNTIVTIANKPIVILHIASPKFSRCESL
jgi:hypothetical protein